MMQFAIGFLHFTPRTFWRMTMVEYVAAQKGWLRANGHEVEEKPTLNSEWYANLIARVERDRAKKNERRS